MARRPNYGQQRADVNRSKQAKQEAKLREREEAVARRRAGRDEPFPGDDGSEAMPAEGAAPEGVSGQAPPAEGSPDQASSDQGSPVGASSDGQPPARD